MAPRTYKYNLHLAYQLLKLYSYILWTYRIALPATSMKQETIEVYRVKTADYSSFMRKGDNFDISSLKCIVGLVGLVSRFSTLTVRPANSSTRAFYNCEQFYNIGHRLFLITGHRSLQQTRTGPELVSFPFLDQGVIFSQLLLL